MRINGFTQIKAFYSWTFSNQDKHIKPQHISLYLFLLNQNNRANWIEWFKCPYDLAMTGSCISSKKTYYKCLNDLQEWKLIVYKKGVNNWKAPIIKLEVLKDTSTVPQSEPQPTQADEPLLTTLPTHIYKLITDNKKLITLRLYDWISSEGKLDDKIDTYTFLDFVADWNKYKERDLKQRSNLKTLDSSAKDNLIQILKDGYKAEDIKKAIIGLFMQKIFPNDGDYTTDPRHLLKDGGIFLNKYIDAFDNNKKEIYGKAKQEY